MKPSIIFFKSCMSWLSQISVYTCRITKIRKELEGLISSSISGDEKERAILIMQRIDMALKKFMNTETRIIHTIKQNENYPGNVYVALSETKFAVKNEEYLFRIMQYHYTECIELQQMVNEYLKENAEQRHVSKIIQLPRSITIKKCSKAIEKSLLNKIVQVLVV